MIALLATALAAPGQLVAGLEGHVGARSAFSRELGTAGTIGWRSPPPTCP